MAPNTTTDTSSSTDSNMMKGNEVSDVKVHNTNEVASQGGVGCCKKLSDTIIGAFEKFFYRLGYIVGDNPVKTILISLFISALPMIGFIEYFSESRAEKLWVSQDSIYIEYQDWVKVNFPTPNRVASFIMESTDNILTPDGLKKLMDLDKVVKAVGNGTDVEWKKICFSPVNKDGFCFPSTLLSIWGDNHTVISALNTSSILAGINQKPLKNPLTQIPMDISTLLAGITRDSSGSITEALAAKSTYFIKNQQIEKGGQKVDEQGEKWEKEFVKQVLAFKADKIVTYGYSQTTFRADSGESIQGDVQLLAIGYILVIIYLAVMLGSFSRVNHKIWLAVLGVVVIGLSIGISYGLCSGFGLFVGPVHNILAFLILGIGVDDIFVIIQNWENIDGPTDFSKPIPEMVAEALKHAGASILVTSLTDICAFLIGATTILPALRSFCVYAGVGIIAVFLLTITLFVGFLALDARRQRNRRDACCCCCIKLSDDWQPNECSKKNYLQYYIEHGYARILLSIPGKIVIGIVICVLVGVGSWGLASLKQDFDPNWFLPPGTDTVNYNEANDKLFSGDGVRTSVYVKDVDYFKHQPTMIKLGASVQDNEYVVKSSVQNWFTTFIAWVTVNMPAVNANMTHGIQTNETDFYSKLDMFLKNEGKAFARNIQRNTDTLKKIKASSINVQHKDFDGAKAEIEGMENLQEAVNAHDMDGKQPFAYCRFYINWETNKIISWELLRNLIAAGVVVLVITLFLVADVLVSLLVVLCVGMTLIEVAGFMHLWGLTTDTVTTIILVIAIGLAVDYSAHIGHGFMSSRRGNRNTRAKASLTEIGPAVINGGMSTFLAFILLAASKSYVFTTFFKVFFLVVVFGIFNGVVALPVILSVIGPAPYGGAIQAGEEIGQESGAEMKTKHADDVENPEKPSSPGAATNPSYHASVDNVAAS